MTDTPAKPKKPAKRRKGRKIKRLKDKLQPAEVAAILTFGDRTTMGRAAKEFNVAERTLWRWKAAVESGKWPAVAVLVQAAKDEALDRCKDLLAEVYELALETMKKKIPDATYRELLETVVETGGLKVFRETLGGNEGSSSNRSGAGSPPHAVTPANTPGGSGVQTALRVVGKAT